jgi:hypothetical protein
VAVAEQPPLVPGRQPAAREPDELARNDVAEDDVGGGEHIGACAGADRPTEVQQSARERV